MLGGQPRSQAVSQQLGHRVTTCERGVDDRAFKLDDRRLSGSRNSAERCVVLRRLARVVLATICNARRARLGGFNPYRASTRYR
jgi:hypothetical protein